MSILKLFSSTSNYQMNGETLYIYVYSMLTIFAGGFSLNFLVLASLLRPISYYEAVYAKELKRLEFECQNEEGREMLKIDDDPSQIKYEEVVK